MPARAGNRPSANEMIEFDNWGAEQIHQADDIEKLEKAADYYRQQGFSVTADAVERRLVQLVKGQSSAGHAETVGVLACIESFQAELKQRSRLAKQPTRLPQMQQDLYPPVRGASGPQCAVKSGIKDNHGSAAMRQSLDLAGEKDQQLLGSEGLTIPSQGTTPKTAAHTAGIPDAIAAMATALGMNPAEICAAAGLTSEQAKQRAKPLVQEVKVKGAKRTQQLAEQNEHLSRQDRLAMSEQKRCSGNDYFRAGAYADAVEEYTLALFLNPSDTACYTNRAASYLKLKEYESAANDCDRALLLLENNTEPEQTLQGKALLRRAEAYVGLANHSRALQDYEAVLRLFPEQPKAQQGAAAARTALGIKPGMRRMAVVETDVSSDEIDEEKQQQSKQQGEEEATKGSAQLTCAVPVSDQAADAGVSSTVVMDACAAEAAREAAAFKNSESNHAVKAAAAAADPAIESAEPDAAQGCSSSSSYGKGMYRFTAVPTAGTSASTSGAADAVAAKVQDNADVHLVAELQEAMGHHLATVAGQDSRESPAEQLKAAYSNEDADSEIDSSSDSSSFSGSEDATAGFELDDDEPASQDLADLVINVPPPLEEQLTQLKDAGNAKFTAKAYSEAVALYSKALQHAPDAVLLYVNRAMASLELNRHDRAHEDSSIAIALQPDNFEAYHKRYKAKQGLRDYLGAQVDLATCIQYAPKGNKKLLADLQAELEQLQQEAAHVMAAEVATADAAQEASMHAYGSCVIEEVAESPEEMQQRVFNELQGKEQWYAKLAAKSATAAAQKRAEYEQQRQQQLQQHQEGLQALQEHQQRQRQRRQMLAEQAAHLSAERKARTAARDARRKAKADAAARRAAGSSSASVAIDMLNRSSGKNAGAIRTAAAEPPTPPASPFDSKLVHNMAAARAAKTATKATGNSATAAAALAESRSSSYSTPSATPLTNATPAATPVGSFIAASTLLQQQLRTVPTPEQIQDQVAAEVEALKDKGNALLQQGKLEEAEAAYQEALQLDGDNVKLLLNLALLRLKQEDGAGAVRCCEEVMAQQGLPELARLKALVRHGLGLELLGEWAKALTQLSDVAERNTAAGRIIDEQLARDIARIAAKVQQQHHLQQQQRQQESPELDSESTATALEQADVATTANSTRGIQQQEQPRHHLSDQQQEPVAPASAFTGMRASIRVVAESDSSGSENETEHAGNWTVTNSTSGNDAVSPVPVEEVLTAGAASTTQIATNQQQQQQLKAAVPATAFCSRRLAKVAVVFESDSESSDEGDGAANSVTQQQRRQEADINIVTSSFTTAEVSAQETAAAQATENASPENGIKSRTRQAEAESAQQQQQHDAASSPLKRSLSAGEADSEEVSLAAFAALGSMRGLLQKTIYSPTQELQRRSSSDSQASSNGHQDSSSSEGNSSSSDTLHWDPLEPGPVELPDDTESLALFEKFAARAQQCAQQQEQQECKHQAVEAAVLHKLDAAENALLPALINFKSLKNDQGIPDEKALAAWQQQFATACTELANKAATQRAAGEKALQKGSTQLALKHYNAAVAASPKDPLSYAGRAVVWMRLKRWQHAEEDLTVVIVLANKEDSNSLLSKYTATVDAALLRKVHQRRALVWKELGKLKEAIAEVKQLLAATPSDSSLQRLIEECKQLYAKQVQQALQAAQQLQQQQQQEEQEEVSAAVGASEVQKPDKSAAAAEPVSHVQRHSIIIEETDGSESDSDTEQEVVQMHNQQHATAQRKLQQDDIQQHSDSAAALAGTCAAASMPAAVEGKHAASRLQTLPAATKPAAAAPAAAERVLHQLAQKQYAAPTRVADFVNAAKTLAAAKQPGGSSITGTGGQQTLGQYVRQVEPAKYKALIKTELNQEILTYLLLGYQDIIQKEPSFVAEALLALSKVERFSLVMPMACVNKSIRTGLQGLLQQLEQVGHDVAGLKGSYKLALK